MFVGQLNISEERLSKIKRLHHYFVISLEKRKLIRLFVWSRKVYKT